MQWLDPWCGVAELGPEFAAAFERALGREAAPGHPLHGVPVAAIGKRDGTDDVLFRLLDGSGRVTADCWPETRRLLPCATCWKVSAFAAPSG